MTLLYKNKAFSNLNQNFVPNHYRTSSPFVFSTVDFFEKKISSDKSETVSRPMLLLARAFCGSNSRRKIEQRI